MTTKIQRSLRDLNRIMSDDYNNLCDRLENMRLSHNRKVRLLKRTAELLSYINTTSDMVQEVHYLFLAIMHELDNPERVYEKYERRING